MRRKLLALLIVLVAPSAYARETSSGWLLVHRKDGFDLYNLFHRSHLDVVAHGRRFDLATSEGSGRVRVVTRASTPLRCEDVVAISVRGLWLAYEKGSAVEIATRAGKVTDDLFQWRIHCTNNDLARAPIAIANTIAGDALVGCRRLYGAPFCWDDRQLMGVAQE